MTTLPTNIDHPCYHDDDAARIMFEAIRWPQGATCPKCGKIDTVAPLGGELMGPGWYWCSPCRFKFTVRVGSVLERSHIPLHKWMVGFRLYASSKKGFSAHQLMRTVNLGSYKTAWFMAHRIREAMDGADQGPPLGGENKIVEADETLFGVKARNVSWRYVNGVGWIREKIEQMIVLTLVERGGRGVYQHCSEKHLNRYLSEFDFRYSNRVRLGVDDAERAQRAIRGRPAALLPATSYPA